MQRNPIWSARVSAVGIEALSKIYETAQCWDIAMRIMVGDCAESITDTNALDEAQLYAEARRLADVARESIRAGTSPYEAGLCARLVTLWEDAAFANHAKLRCALRELQSCILQERQLERMRAHVPGRNARDKKDDSDARIPRTARAQGQGAPPESAPKHPPKHLQHGAPIPYRAPPFHNGGNDHWDSPF